MFDIPCWRPLHFICNAYIFDQCMFGGRAKKPTLLLGHRLDLHRLVRRCDHPLQNFVCEKTGETYFSKHEKVAGAVNGVFATAALAAYPLEMNLMLAWCMVEFLDMNPELPRHVLILFSGDDTDPDGLPAMLRELEVLVTAVDLVNVHLSEQDILNEEVWCMMVHRLSAGEFGILFAAPPCRTFSLARTRPNCPPVLRDRQSPEGLSRQDYKLAGISDAEASKVQCDNTLSQRTADACQIMANLSRPFAVEQPWPWKEDTAIVILPVADKAPAASGPTTPEVQVVESDEEMCQVKAWAISP